MLLSKRGRPRGPRHILASTGISDFEALIEARKVCPSGSPELPMIHSRSVNLKRAASHRKRRMGPVRFSAVIKTLQFALQNVKSWPAYSSTGRVRRRRTHALHLRRHQIIFTSTPPLHAVAQTRPKFPATAARSFHLSREGEPLITLVSSRRFSTTFARMRGEEIKASLSGPGPRC